MSAFNAIRQAFEQRMVDLYSTTPVQFPNVPFDTPPSETDSWVRFTVTFSGTEQIALGGTRKYRHIGLTNCEIFTPKNKGPIEAHELADEISGLFRNINFSDIQTRVPSVVGPGSEDGKWFRILLSIPFYFDEVSAD